MKLLRVLGEKIYIYEVVNNNCTDEKYGIKVHSQTCKSDFVVIDNITTDICYINIILKFLADNLVSPVHCQDIIEEFISC